MHSVRIVSRRFSSRYVVRGFGFCDLNSPDISRRVMFTIFVQMDLISALSLQNIEVVIPVMGTNLIQRGVELLRVLPFNVFPRSLFTSNLDRVQDVRDGWKIAAADHHNDHDYG